MSEGKVELPDYLRDGFEVHRAAVTRGAHILALPRQVLLVGAEKAVPSRFSFAHGVPEASTLSALTFAQDRRLRRALLERAKVPQPKGATFSWKSRGRARRWTDKLGYPVIVKEVIGENPARSVRNISSRSELIEGIKTLRQRLPEDRSPGSNPHLAGYAATRLSVVLDENENEVAPPRTRFLIEEQLAGKVLRSAVVGGTIITTVELDPDNPANSKKFIGGLTATATETIVRAADAIPGLGFAVVDAVFEGPELRAVVELSERPRIAAFNAAEEDLGGRIGDAIVRFQAERASYELGDQVEDLDVTIEVEGLRRADAVAERFPTVVEAFGVEAHPRATEPVLGNFQCRVVGRTTDIVTVVELFLAGLLFDDRPAAIEYVIGEA